jgi:kojibiose phosphorylase/nigerose phosphorylase
VSRWFLEEKGFDLDRAISQGNKFLTGNGYMGIRGTLEEFEKKQLVAINLAGIYDRAGEGWREPLNAPNGLYTVLHVDGETYRLPEKSPIAHTLYLDYRKALFTRKTTWQTAKGKVTIETERFASLEEPHLLVMKYCILTEFCADIELVTGIDADVWDINGPHYAQIALSEEGSFIKAIGTTSENHEKVCVIEGCQTDFVKENKLGIGEKRILRNLAFTAEAGKRFEVTKWIGIYTSKDAKDFEEQAKVLVSQCMEQGYGASKDLHIQQWEERWRVSEVIIEGDDVAMEALNYSLYHLQAIAPRHTESLSIAARGLSGQTYKGAVFWDTEMFMLDFFLYTEPCIARTLLKYRLDTLEGAKSKAKSYGYEGAFYPWESQEGGYEACSDYNVIDVFTKRPMRTYFRDKQIHISSAVVYGIVRYLETTGDYSILEEGGIETVLECAKFYHSLLLKRVHKAFYELRDVIGPDEYHERVNNNGYTNRMAKYTFEQAVRMCDLLKQLPKSTRMRIEALYYIEKLREQFEEAAGRIYIPEPDEEGIIEQFDGYKKLEDVSVEQVRSRLLNEKEYWGGAYGVAAHTQVIKQADVVTWLTLFPKDFEEKILLKNWEYYEPRTEHGSSLSACMYALLACRCGMAEKAYPFFLKSASAEIDGEGKQWAGLIYIGGTHPAAAGGAYMTAINGFGGVYFEEGKIKVKPQLPPMWKKLRFKVWYKGMLYEVEETHQDYSVRTLSRSTR